MRFPLHFNYLKDSNIIWFNPCWGCLGFLKRIFEFQKEQRVDFRVAWSHRDMKRNKEIYATAMAALCMQESLPEKHGWWFTKPPQDPPDGVIGAPIEDINVEAIIMHGREIEIVEYLGGSLVETIKNKLHNKSYEPNTVLVCLLSSWDSIKIFDFETISEQLKQLNFPLAHIFLVGHGFQITPSLSSLTKEELVAEMLKIFCVQLLPKYTTINISPSARCKSFQEGREQAWLKFTKLGKGITFQKVTIAETPKLFD